MIVVTVHLNETTPNGRHKKVVWEVDATGMKDVVSRLNIGEIVFGCALHLRKDKGGDGKAMEVFGASEIALTKGEVVRLEQPAFSLVRYEDSMPEPV